MSDRHFSITIQPGRTDQNATLWFEGMEVGKRLTRGSVELFEATGRQNLIRLLPYGNGDSDPPSTTNEITRMRWVLEGLTD